MSSRQTLPVFVPAMVACFLIALCAAFALPFARSAEASLYKMVLCGANSGANGFNTSTNTTSSNNPSGIMAIENHCGPAPYPAGGSAFLRIAENQPEGVAGNSAYGSVSWTAPPHIQIAAGGGYTRYPGQFNDGWRGRFWAERYDGSGQHILVQGTGVQNNTCEGVCWNTTPNFAPHLWPFGGYGSYRRFVFELTCMRAAGCDRAGWNVVEANSFQLVLNDVTAPASQYTGPRPMQDGQWVRGEQPVTWQSADEGSGIRFERLRIDGQQRGLIDRRASCNIDSNGAVGEFARDFQPCPRGGWYGAAVTVNTATLSDGLHDMAVCVQDYGQAQGISGTGGETCNGRTIRTDNSPPGSPSGLKILSTNPERYVDRFDAEWRLPPDPGSPIAKVHYDVVDEAGKVVVPEKTLTATNPTALKGISGPKEPGVYRLRVWLEDTVGLRGPAASVLVPHDTKPPAAPQDLSVTSPETSRASQGFDVRWRNITDNGAPISEVRYQVLNAGGEQVVSTRELKGDNPQEISNLETPRDAGGYTLKVWLVDAEGNVGAPSSAPLSYRCPRSEQSGGSSLSAGLGAKSEQALTVKQGEGSTLSGSLTGNGGAIRGAAICVFSRVLTDSDRAFIGVAVTGQGGDYSYPIPAEASREITAIYRGDQREVAATATISTRVKPAFKVRKRVVKNKRAAVFFGAIPGPHNDQVIVVLQVKSGKGWRAFRRYRTRSDGRYVVRYRFTRTQTPTLYIMRAQVRSQVGYPYLQGNSAPLKVKVMP